MLPQHGTLWGHAGNALLDGCTFYRVMAASGHSLPLITAVREVLNSSVLTEHRLVVNLSQTEDTLVTKAGSAGGRKPPAFGRR